MIKKIIYLSFLVFLLIGSYYYSSYSPYIKKIDKIIKNVEGKFTVTEINTLKNSIFEDKKINIKVSKSNNSANHLLRVQAMMAVYNNFFYESRIKEYRKLWMLDRLLWGYMSYVSFNDNEVLKVYIYFNSNIKDS